ncbi:hypothetical protein ScPMuIL_019000 [Solemya velum]
MDPRQQVYLQGQQNVYYPGPSHQGQQPYTHPSYIGQHQYGNMYPPSQGQMYPQPQGQMYPPPQGQMYPPPQGQMYHPPQGQMNPPPQGQMNPPPQGQMNLPPQGQMNPQPQGQMNPPPQKPPEATPKPVKQRTERTIETGGLEVQAATGNTVHDPPDGGKRAWLIVLACFFINMCNAIIQQLFMLSKDSMNDDLKDAKVAKMTEVYVDMRAISAPIGAIIAVKFGYRILTIVGGILMIFGFFIASFLDNDSIDGIGFLVAGFGGIGGAFWSLAAIVAVLEYFKTKRIRALLAANCGSVVGALIMMLIFVFGEVKLEWQKTFKAVLAPAGIGIIAGATLVPLKLIMADDSGQTFLARTLGIFSWKLFKKPALFLVMIIFFLENFVGYGVALNKTKRCLVTICVAGGQYHQSKITTLIGKLDPELEQDEIITIVLVNVAAPLVGLLALFFWKNKELAIVLIWLGPVNLLCGTLANIAPSLDSFGLVLGYVIIYGVCSGLFTTILNNAVPESFGAEHIRIVEGLLGFAAGVGVICSGPADESINEEYDWESSFHLGGSLLILSGICALVSYYVLKKQT